jgi:hypothetical protein
MGFIYYGGCRALSKEEFPLFIELIEFRECLGALKLG